MLIDHQRNNRTRSRRSEALARNQRQEQQTAVKQTLWWLAAGTAVAALSFAFTTQARAQITPTPASEFNQMETYACSAESQALLSQVELMKVAGGQLRQRWAEQGFAVGQHMPLSRKRL